MQFIQTNILSIPQKKAILKLWNQEYPKRISYKDLSDFEKYLEALTKQSHILMIDEKQEIKGWYFDFIREGEKWFAMILDSNVHGNGFGTELLNLAKEKETVLNGWAVDHNNDQKQNGEIYKSPIGFYLKNGFKVISEIRLELEQISAVKIKWERME